MQPPSELKDYNMGLHRNAMQPHCRFLGEIGLWPKVFGILKGLRDFKDFKDFKVGSRGLAMRRNTHYNIRKTSDIVYDSNSTGQIQGYYER